jgi:hypothetical protein
VKIYHKLILNGNHEKIKYNNLTKSIYFLNKSKIIKNMTQIPQTPRITESGIPPSSPIRIVSQHNGVITICSDSYLIRKDSRVLEVSLNEIHPGGPVTYIFQRLEQEQHPILSSHGYTLTALRTIAPVVKSQQIDNAEAMAMRQKLTELVYHIDPTHTSTPEKTRPYIQRTQNVDLLQILREHNISLDTLLTDVQKTFELARTEKIKRTGEFNNSEYAKKIAEQYRL